MAVELRTSFAAVLDYLGETPDRELLAVTALAEALPSEAKPLSHLLLEILGFPDPKAAIPWSVQRDERGIYERCFACLLENLFCEKNVLRPEDLSSTPVGGDGRFKNLREELVRAPFAEDVRAVAMLAYRYHLLYPLHLLRNGVGVPYRSSYRCGLMQDVELVGVCDQMSPRWTAFLGLEIGNARWELFFTLPHYGTPTCEISEWSLPPHERALQMVVHAAHDLRIPLQSITLSAHLQGRLDFSPAPLIARERALLATPLPYNLRFFRLLQRPLEPDALDGVLRRMETAVSVHLR